MDCSYAKYIRGLLSSSIPLDSKYIASNVVIKNVFRFI